MRGRKCQGVDKIAGARRPNNIQLPPPSLTLCFSCDSVQRHTYTHTHTIFPCVRSSPGRPTLRLSAYPLCARTKSTSHRITRVARVRATSAETRSCVQTFTVSRSSGLFLFPHIRASSFHYNSVKRLPSTDSERFGFCVFPTFISKDNGA